MGAVLSRANVCAYRAQRAKCMDFRAGVGMAVRVQAPADWLDRLAVCAWHDLTVVGLLVLMMILWLCDT